jgi:hypothetical protein
MFLKPKTTLPVVQMQDPRKAALRVSHRGDENGAKIHEES